MKNHRCKKVETIRIPMKALPYCFCSIGDHSLNVW